MSSRLQVLAAAALGCFGFWALASGTTFGSGFTEGFTPRFGVDGLTAFFLGMLGLVAAPTLAFASRYYAETRRGRANSILTGVFVLVLAEVLCARDPITFLAGWELMTLLPAAIILVSRSDEEARRTVFLYLAITHLAGACTWVAVLLAAHAGAFGSSGAVAPGSGLQIAIAIAALVGMGTKAGVMPMHSWLPRAHPIAPAPVSALMSGVMIKVAIYGLVRVLVDWLGPLPIWFGVLVLALGALSALGGVTYALFQHDLKRLLAFHSIENVGIIVLGLGACLLLRARGADTWAAIALAAALLHTLNHAVFKALLFLGAGSFERAAGSLGLDRLGGLLRRLPWTGGAFLVGALAIAGAASVERILLRMGDAAGPPARAGSRPPGRRAGRCARARRPGRDRGARGSLLRQGDRPGAARPSAQRSGRERDRASVADVGRGRRARRRVRRPWRSAGPAPRLARVPRSVARGPPHEHRSAPAEHRFAADPRNRNDPRRGHRRARARPQPQGRGARADLGLRSARRAGARLDERRASPSRCGSCSKAFCAPSARSPCTARAGRCRRFPTAVGCRNCSKSRSSSRRCGSRSAAPRRPAVCKPAGSAPTPPT